MQESNIIPISLDELFKRLEEKYNGTTEGYYTSARRYPSSLIFFDSKGQYKKFLDEIHFEKRAISASIKDPEKVSCYKIKKWLKDQFEEAKKKPLVIHPITEYIRLCSDKDQLKMIEALFEQIVQAEGSSLIIPMLDYSNNYSQFLQSFIHQERMSEVFSCISKDEGDDPAIALILDRTRRVDDSNASKITSPLEWLRLWETGAIASQNKIIITDDRLIDAIKVSNFSVPKVEKIPIENEKDYLARFCHIDPSAFTLEPTPQIWDYIFEALSPGGRKKTWKEIVTKIIGSTENLEQLLPSLWEEASQNNPHRIIQRWFWLNEAKKYHLKSTFLEMIIQEASEPEKLLDTAYFKGLSDPNISTIALEERRNLLKSFESPLFHVGTSTFEQTFNQWMTAHEDDPEKAILHLTGIFEFEQKYLLKTMISLFKEQGTISQDIFNIVQQCWPAYAAYIEPLLSSQETFQTSIHENLPLFADTYMRAYVSSKLIYDQPNSALKSMQEDYLAQWTDFKAAQNMGKVLSHGSESFQENIKSTGYLFLDGVGYEWGRVLQTLFENRGWNIAQVHPLLSPLPSDTEHSPLSNPIETYREFDTRLHKRYSYPETLHDEIRILEDIVDEIHQKYRDRASPIWVVSDHGSTVFARKGRALNLKNISKEHGGRFGVNNSSKKLGTENVYCVSDTKHDLAVSMTYDNLGDTCPQGEAHGGGVPEEILACALLLYPPGADIAEEEFKISPAKTQYDAIEDEVKIQIEGAYCSPISKIEVRVNKNPRFTSPCNIVNGSISIPLSKLKEKGLIVGENILEITVNHAKKATCQITLVSGSSDTGFDELFNM